ncbi:putative short chain dehydrogenase, partial [Aspergillus flavus AF70]
MIMDYSFWFHTGHLPLISHFALTPPQYPKMTEASYIIVGVTAVISCLAIFWAKFRNQGSGTRPFLAEDKVVLVTGGLSGLGREIAELYRVQGAKVAILDIKDEASLPWVPNTMASKYYKCDVSDGSEVEATLKKIGVALGNPDILINCAAMPINRLPFCELQSESFARTIRTNLLGPVNLTRAVLPLLMQSTKRGSIVNISSVVAHLYPAGLSDYVSSKAALSALHHCLEAEARWFGYDKQVDFFLVEVGQMDTPLFSWIKPPNSLLAPVLEPRYVAEKVFAAVSSGGGRIIRLPKYAAWVCGYDMLPVPVQRFA